jgi:hypothetical protein
MTCDARHAQRATQSEISRDTQWDTFKQIEMLQKLRSRCKKGAPRRALHCDACVDGQEGVRCELEQEVMSLMCVSSNWQVNHKICK